MGISFNLCINLWSKILQINKIILIRIIFANHIEKKYMFVVYSLIINSQKHSTIVIKNCLKTQQIFLLTIALLLISAFSLALF